MYLLLLALPTMSLLSGMCKSHPRCAGACARVFTPLPPCRSSMLYQALERWQPLATRSTMYWGDGKGDLACGRKRITIMKVRQNWTESVFRQSGIPERVSACMSVVCLPSCAVYVYACIYVNICACVLCVNHVCCVYVCMYVYVYAYMYILYG